ncbi:Hypothetical protein A7A1_2794 [Bacillus subtilis subsp. subtilis str. BSP1]|nr:Hypothetical protein A7A1_2794 [Bacillus subtilis subsp. subtilis str. BSP1]
MPTKTRSTIDASGHDPFKKAVAHLSIDVSMFDRRQNGKQDRKERIYMALTKEQTQHLYHKLLDMQKELSGEKKETESMTEEVGELSNGVDNHMADHGTLVTDRMTDQTVKEIDRELLEEVNRALQKMKDGTYGVCEKTGQEIPYERLEAVPYARMTVEAQADVEDDLETDAPSYEREFHKQVKDLSNKETIDQKSSQTYEILDREQDSK